MIAPIDKARGEGNCGRGTDRGEEACECVRKYRPVIAVGRILTKTAEAEKVSGTVFSHIVKTVPDTFSALRVSRIRVREIASDDQRSGEVRPQVQTTYPRDHRPQPGHFDGTSFDGAAKLRSWLDRLLRLGLSVETVRGRKRCQEPFLVTSLKRFLTPFPRRDVKRSATHVVAKATGTWQRPLPAVWDSRTRGLQNKDC